MQRLRTRAQFQAALAGGTVARTPHFVLHRCALGATPAVAPERGAAGGTATRERPLFGVDDVWLGAMAPKRWARRAVTRNAIKRQIYEAAARHGAALPRAAHVVRLRAAFDRRRFVSATSERLRAAVRAELEQLFAHAAQVRSGGAPAPASVATGAPP